MPDNVFHICWTIDCESSHPAIQDLDLGRNAVRGFTELVEKAGWKGTFFLIPEEVAPLRQEFRDVAARHHEIGIHPHPLASGYENDYLGTYSRETQLEILQRGLAQFREHLGVGPLSCRPGYCSANDATFSVMEECGIRQASASMPGRRMAKVASVWAGAPLFAHRAHAHNRVMEGAMDLIEVPITVDWESMIWGGAHPQDLRVEFTDAKNHSLLIEKVMQRQVDEKLPFKALVILTHNLFRFADDGDFRRATMSGMIDAIRHCGEKLKVKLVGCSIAEAATAYRTAVPAR